MPDYKRVRLEESGHEVTVGNVRAGMTVINKPAVDNVGRPLRPKYRLDLRGKDLDAALEAAGLPKGGTADEKRERLAEHRMQTSDALAASANDTTNTGGESATSEEDSK